MAFENYTYDAADPARRHEWDMVDMDLSIANAIRRTILTDIPNVGFLGEELPAEPGAAASVKIAHNTGPLHNEFIAHRIGMLALHFSAEELDNFQEGTWRFELDVSTSSAQKKTVHASDFKIFRDDVELSRAEAARIFPPHPVTGETPVITRLRENERLALTAFPVKSTARQHAGFSPVSLCTFSFVVNPEAAAGATNILDKERCYYKDKRGDPTRIHFSIETECALTPKELVDRAFSVVLDKLERALAAIQNPDDAYVTHRPAKDTRGREFVFQNEDDTLGNLIQSLTYNETLRKKQTTPFVTYVGYCCPHPLDPTMVVRLVAQETEEDDTEVPEDTYVNIFRSHVQRIQAMLTGLRAAWDDFAPKA